MFQEVLEGELEQKYGIPCHERCLPNSWLLLLAAPGCCCCCFLLLLSAAAAGRCCMLLGCCSCYCCCCFAGLLLLLAACFCSNHYQILRGAGWSRMGGGEGHAFFNEKCHSDEQLPTLLKRVEASHTSTF